MSKPEDRATDAGAAGPQEQIDGIRMNGSKGGTTWSCSIFCSTGLPDDLCRPDAGVSGWSRTPAAGQPAELDSRWGSARLAPARRIDALVAGP